MFEGLRRMISVRRADRLAEVVPPVEVPRPPAPPGGGSAARLDSAHRELAALVADMRQALDAATAAGFDALIDTWGRRWDADDDREAAEYRARLHRQHAAVEALIAATELAHRRCERGWVLADRDYLAARNRLGATDPHLVPLADEGEETAEVRLPGQRAATSPFGRFDRPRSTA